VNTVCLSANTSWYLYNFRAATIRALARAGYRVVCLSPEDAYSQKLVDELPCVWLPLTMDNQGNNPLADLHLFWQFYRHYRRLRPSAALHFTIKNNIYGTWAARLNSVAAINVISGLGTAFIRSGVVPGIARLLYRSSQRFAQHIFCQNPEDLQLLIQQRVAPGERISLLPGSGVDLTRFNPSLREPPATPFVFLYAGRMLADKGLHELISAVHTLNADGFDCRLWLSGFADVQNLSAISATQLSAWGMDPAIDWLGPTDAMQTVYAKVDCVVLPSYREGLPRSLLEAGAMGLPVVTTDVAGCRTVVEDGYNGILCEAKNGRALADAMKKMLQLSPAQRFQMGANGRQRVAAYYSEQRVVDATLVAVQQAQSRIDSTD
jgi:glycosyltransferase involved in cell wall biosynthesis